MRAGAALLLFLTLLVPASAQECVPTTSDAEWTSCNSSGDPCFYGDWDMCQPQCIFSYWVYQESNAIDGLQRNDDVKDDTCRGQIESDTIIY